MNSIVLVPVSWYRQLRVALPFTRAANEKPWNNWQPILNNENTPMLSRDEHLQGLWRVLGIGD